MPRQPTTVANIDPFGITFGQDEAYWTPQFGGDSVARYTSSGIYTIPITFPTGSGPRFITRGAGDTLWVPLETSQKIARISGVELPDTIAPAITKLKLTNKTFKRGAKKTALIAKKTPTGTTIKFSLSEAATVKVFVQKPRSGRVSGKNCVAPTKKLKKAKKCTRWSNYTTLLRRAGKAGSNSVSFTGRFGSIKLSAGRYRFALYAEDAAGNVTPKPSTARFSVVTK